MIYDFIMRFRLLESEELLEDKMVKYGGELDPKFGWCAIYVGGPASGKGSAASYLSRLQGDHFNVDDLKEIERMWEIRDPKTGRPHSDNFETPSQMAFRTDSEGNVIFDKNRKPVYYDYYRNMANPDFIGELHDEMKPLSKKWRKLILSNPENARGRQRLPNIIFDITGDKVEKVTEIIDSLKPHGYKIAILWMLSTPERAMRNNSQRDRVVDIDKVFIPKHEDVIQSMEELFASGEIEKVDDFWVIDTAMEINPKTDPVAYHDAQNVYHIPTNKDGLKAIEQIAKRIEYNKTELARIKQKRKNLIKK